MSGRATDPGGRRGEAAWGGPRSRETAVLAVWAASRGSVPPPAGPSRFITPAPLQQRRPGRKQQRLPAPGRWTARRRRRWPSRKRRRSCRRAAPGREGADGLAQGREAGKRLGRGSECSQKRGPSGAGDEDLPSLSRSVPKPPVSPPLPRPRTRPCRPLTRRGPACRPAGWRWRPRWRRTAPRRAGGRRQTWREAAGVKGQVGRPGAARQAGKREGGVRARQAELEAAAKAAACGRRVRLAPGSSREGLALGKALRDALPDGLLGGLCQSLRGRGSVLRGRVGRRDGDGRGERVCGSGLLCDRERLRRGRGKGLRKRGAAWLGCMGWLGGGGAAGVGGRTAMPTGAGRRATNRHAGALANCSQHPNNARSIQTNT
jgi:hypothetical protein